MGMVTSVCYNLKGIVQMPPLIVHAPKCIFALPTR